MVWCAPLGKQALPAQACMLLCCLCSLESVRRVCLHVLIALHLCAQSVQLDWCLSLLFTAAHSVDTVTSLPVCTYNSVLLPANQRWLMLLLTAASTLPRCMH